MPRRTKAESAVTAAEVREAARTLFAAHGYAAVGLEQVAAAAGVTRGAVYHHFGSKDRLLAAALEHGFAEWGRGLARTAPADNRRIRGLSSLPRLPGNNSSLPLE